MRATLVKSIRPSQHGVKIRAIRGIQKAGVLVEFFDQGSRDKLLGVIRETLPELQSMTPPDRNPRIKVTGIPADAKDGDVVSAVYEQVVLPRTLFEREAMEDNFRILSNREMYGKRKMVVQCTPLLASAMLGVRSIEVGWLPCRIAEDTSVVRCYHCMGQGHVQKYCWAPQPTCGHCAIVGHDIRSCKRRGKEPRCAPCQRMRRPDTHGYWDTNCPSRIARAPVVPMTPSISPCPTK